MSRLDFLNWNPDADDNNNEGLTIATNCVHEPEGYKAVHLISALAFSTTGGLGESSATIAALSNGLPAVIAKPVGSQGDLFCAWLSGGPLLKLHVGLNGVTGASNTTGYPLSFAKTFISNTETPVAIYSFDVSESPGKIFFSVEARLGTHSPSTTEALKYSAYMNF